MGLFDVFKKKSTPALVPIYPISFEIAGLFNRENEAKAVMGGNPKLKKARKIEGQRIFVLSPFEDACELVPEPSNPHDSNAIQVVVQGHVLGYVPRELQGQVVPRLRAGQKTSVKLLGGNYRMYEDGEWVTYKNSIKGTVTIG